MALVKKQADKKTSKAKSPEDKPKRRLPLPKFLRAIGGYFKGSWDELRQTKWPTRRATWQLTTAVIIFTAILMLFIIGLDYVFDILFQRLVL